MSFDSLQWSSSPTAHAPQRCSSLWRGCVTLVAVVVLAGCSDQAPPSPADDSGGSSAATTGTAGAASSSGQAGASTSGTTGGSGGTAVGAGGAGGDPGFYGSSRCDTSGLPLCDGFEGTEIDPALWTKITTAGTTLTIDSKHAARGSRALHVSASNAEKTNGYIRETTTFPAANNRFYGRAFVYLEGQVPTNNFNYFSATGPGATYNLGGTTKPFGSADGEHVIRFNYQPLDIVSKSTTPVPVGVWNCWEWYFKGDEPNELHFWLDEVELAEMAVIGGTSQGQWVAPEFDRMSFGFHHAHAEPAPSYEVWVDEVAVDASRIGCAK